MADSEGVALTASLCQTGTDDEEEKEKGLASLMERLRNREKMHTSKSWQDTCKVWKHSITVSRPNLSVCLSVLFLSLWVTSSLVRSQLYINL
ncbi:hypothetical protein LSH36_153g01000 [Paralvinella palmiformis]|uniref:Uncharacterized protein n=1 Tax=Paralvinella palmiformis TaxID=53620 RepID=A0AAD9N796_9ANNE|nr:hypothetical protein LSH36_153g01000 [Paralvinella palmiformis]